MCSSTRPTKQALMKRRLNLFVVIRILFKHLEKVNPRLLVQAKQVLKDCDALKKKGSPEFQNLAVSLEVHIRKTVGETHWNEALKLLSARKRVFAKTRKEVKASPAPSQNILSTATMNAAMFGTGTIMPMVPQPQVNVQAIIAAYQAQASV